jgi:hypothetical protein
MKPITGSRCCVRPPQRPHDDRAAEQRDELAPFQLMELHSIPASQGASPAFCNRQQG